MIALLARLRGFFGLGGKSGDESPRSESGDESPHSIRLDLRERDERIATMRAEYARLQADREQACARAAQAELEALFRRLASPLSNLEALAALSRQGKEVAAADLVLLLDGVHRELARAGLEPIGAAGEAAAFDPAVHQRLSGGSVRPGTPTVVRAPGFRCREKVLLKAMVSAADAGQESKE